MRDVTFVWFRDRDGAHAIRELSCLKLSAGMDDRESFLSRLVGGIWWLEVGGFGFAVCFCALHAFALDCVECDAVVSTSIVTGVASSD